MMILSHKMRKMKAHQRKDGEGLALCRNLYLLTMRGIKQIAGSKTSPHASIS